MREILILDHGTKRDRFEVRAGNRTYIMGKIPELVRKVRDLTNPEWVMKNVDMPQVLDAIRSLAGASHQVPPQPVESNPSPNRDIPAWLESSNRSLAELKQQIHPEEPIQIK
jgi:hypothetical protein